VKAGRRTRLFAATRAREGARPRVVDGVDGVDGGLGELLRRAVGVPLGVGLVDVRRGGARQLTGAGE
jgi:hypothetical protein